MKGLEKKERIKNIIDNKLRLLKDQYEKGQLNLPKYKEILKSYRSEMIKKDKTDIKKQEYLLDESKKEIYNTFNNLKISKEKLIELIALLALKGKTNLVGFNTLTENYRDPVVKEILELYNL
jgi:hypothetical protein